MEEECECPMCGHVMEWLEDTSWTDGRQRTMDVQCPNCLYRETVYLDMPIGRRWHSVRDWPNVSDSGGRM